MAEADSCRCAAVHRVVVGTLVENACDREVGLVAVVPVLLLRTVVVEAESSPNGGGEADDCACSFASRGQSSLTFFSSLSLHRCPRPPSRHVAHLLYFPPYLLIAWDLSERRWSHVTRLCEFVLVAAR